MVPQLRESEAALVHREGERTRSRRERGDVVTMNGHTPEPPSDDETTIDVFGALAQLAGRLGWDITLPKQTAEGDPVPYVVLSHPDHTDKLIEALQAVTAEIFRPEPPQSYPSREDLLP